MSIRCDYCNDTGLIDTSGFGDYDLCECVSDEQPQAENPKGLSPLGASAAASAETPHPSPVDYTEVVERLRDVADTPTMRLHGRDGLLLDAAQVIEAQAAEIERLKADYNFTSPYWTEVEEENATLKSRIAELEKKREPWTPKLTNSDRKALGRAINTLNDMAEGWVEEAMQASDERDRPAEISMMKISNVFIKASNELTRILSTGGDSHG